MALDDVPKLGWLLKMSLSDHEARAIEGERENNQIIETKKTRDSRRRERVDIVSRMRTKMNHANTATRNDYFGWLTTCV